MMHLKVIDKQEQAELKLVDRMTFWWSVQKLMKWRLKKYKGSMKQSWFFEKINKIERRLPKLEREDLN
jgi:hypothetical protein